MVQYRMCATTSDFHIVMSCNEYKVDPSQNRKIAEKISREIASINLF